jgi:23S rRNA-/tRNA-specific pseudouridylate synthase
LHLHACGLEFSHPSDGRWMHFDSPVPFVLP